MVTHNLTHSLAGDMVMCVLIFAGVHPQAVMEAGMDICNFQGKDIPCLIRWSPKGSITSEILVGIISTLDHLEVFD